MKLNIYIYIYIYIYIRKGYIKRKEKKSNKEGSKAKVMWEFYLLSPKKKKKNGLGGRLKKKK